ncbi:MAG: hypothetical protein BWY75_02111 [bacterium ADurb.Bin425]|nr:MAG: hypothetical protein BWY75_02111 [bacterium ADurb.Bin425]
MTFQLQQFFVCHFIGRGKFIHIAVLIDMSHKGIDIEPFGIMQTAMGIRNTNHLETSFR